MSALNEYRRDIVEVLAVGLTVGLVLALGVYVWLGSMVQSVNQQQVNNERPNWFSEGSVTVGGRVVTSSLEKHGTDLFAISDRGELAGFESMQNATDQKLQPTKNPQWQNL